MQTLTQVREEFYNAIINESTIIAIMPADRLDWKDPSRDDAFPLMTYKYFDTNGVYTFGSPTVQVERVADDIIFQVDIFTDDIDEMDGLFEGLKVALNKIGYRNINAPVEFFDQSVNKMTRPTRWERSNV